MYKHLNISITLCGEEESSECEISLDDVIVPRMLLVAWRRSSLKDIEKGRLISISRTTQCP